MSSTTRIRTSRFAETIGTIAVVAGLVLGLVPGIAAAHVEHDFSDTNTDPDVLVTDFEIDGNVGSTTAGHDWADAADVLTRTDEIETGNLVDKTWFEPGMREEDYGVPGWEFVDKGNIPKGDLQHLFAKTQVSAAGAFVWLGASVVGDSGNVSVVAEFNKIKPATEPTGTYRSDDDLYITFNFGGSGAQVALAQWPGPDAPNGSYGGVASLTEGKHFRQAIGSIDGGDRNFVEIELDLNAIFGDDGLGLECGSFGGLSFRSEVSSGTGDTGGGTTGGNDNSILKDITKPIAIDLDTCSNVNVKKVDEDDDDPIQGAEFTLYQGSGTSGALAVVGSEYSNPCVTDADGTCSFGPVEPGFYTMDETFVPPGYSKDPDLAETFEVGQNVIGGITKTYTDPRIPYTIDVTPENPENAVVGGEPSTHTFTVTICEEGDALEGPNDDGDEDCTGDAPLDLTATDDEGAFIYEALSLDWDGVTPILDVDGNGTQATCRPADGTCAVTVTSSNPGAGTLTATWNTPYQNTSAPNPVSTTTGPSADTYIEDAGTKTWIGYRVELRDKGLNLVGQDHPFFVTVWETDGTTESLADDVTVTFDWDEGTALGSSLKPMSCDTGETATGECSVVAEDGGTPGEGKISVLSVDGVVGDDEELFVPFTSGDIWQTKTWREYRATIDGDSVNPSGNDHTFHVTIEYRDDEALDWQPAPLGTTVPSALDGGYTWGPDGSVVTAESTCLNAGTADDLRTDGVEETNVCTFVVNSSAPGSGILSVLKVEGALLGEAGEADEIFDVSTSATKTWLDFEVDIFPDGDNLVGDLHVFTIYVEEYDGSNYEPIADDSTVTYLLSDGGSSYVSDTCTHDAESGEGGTVNGACTVTVNSATPTSVTLTATGLTGYGEFDTPTDITFGDGNDTDSGEGEGVDDDLTDEATKTWYQYRAGLEADGVNLVGVDHDFTVTAEQTVNGTSWGEVPEGTVITLRETGTGSFTTDADEDGEVTCTTDANGQCTVTVTSDVPGEMTVTVISVSAEDVDPDPITSETRVATVADGTLLAGPVSLDDPDDDDTLSEIKLWIEYRAQIQKTETNLTGQEHIFQVTAEQNDGVDDNEDQDVWDPVPNGTEITYTPTTDPDIAISDTCDSTIDGACTITVKSDDVDKITITLTGVSANDVDDVDDATPVATVGNGALSATVTDGLSATKTWIEVLVDITPDNPTNIAGEAHEFTVDLTITGPAGAIDHTGATVSFTVDGATLVEDDEMVGVTGSTCDEDLAAGVDSCTIVVHSSTPGTADISVTSVEFSYDGKDFGPIDFTDETSSIGEADGPDLDATKTWRAYRTSIELDGLNRVHDEHTFTVTVEYTDDSPTTEGGPTWSLADDVDVTVDKVSGTDTGTVTDGTCTTDASGTCTVTVNSSTAGTGAFKVASIVVKHPETGVDETLGDGGTTDVAFDNSDTADKTWAAFRAWISRDSANITGDEHLFTVKAQYTVGGDWLAVPDGTTIDVSDTGTGSIIDTAEFDSTCEDTLVGTTGGSCDVWVDSGDAGSLDVTVDGLTATIVINEETVDEISRSFTVVFGYDDADDPAPNPGVLDNYQNAGQLLVDDTSVTEDPNGDYVATKSWASYQLRLDPVTATNLLDGTANDPEKNHTITATLTSDDDGLAPIDEQEIRFDIDDGATITATDGGEIFTEPATDGADATCVTDETGKCTITISRDTPGQAVVDAWYSATVGDSAAQTINSDTTATKTWTTFRLTVTPDTAVNLVDTPHVFTVTLWESILTADCGEDAVDGFCLVQTNDLISITPDDTPGDDLTIDTTDCDDGTNAQGQCVVTVTSGSVRAFTLTATYLESYAGYATEVIGKAPAVFSDSGDKSWIDYDIDVVGDGENLVNNPHTFTVQLSTIVPDGEGGTTKIGIEGAHPEVEIGGRGTIEANTCAEGQLGTVVDDATPEIGTCTVTITSGVAGLTTIDASYVGYARIDGDELVDGPADESRIYDTSTSVEDDFETGEKLWVDYLLEMTGNAVNAVDDPHTFTATLRRSDDGALDEDYLPVEGATLTFTIDGVGERVDGAGDVGEDLTCVTGADGKCDLVINSGEAGATDVSVSYDAIVGPTERTDTEERTKQWVDIELVKTAVTDDGFSDGDLIADPGGFPFLAFTSSDQGPKTAVFEYLITNPSNVTLENVVLTDDRLGAINLADFPACQTLDPGETCAARASEQFDYFDATGSLASLITNVGTVTATGGGEEVSDTDDATITLVAVQSSILIDLVKDVVAGEGDVEVVDGRPIVSWSEEEYEAGESKTVRYRFTVTNISNSPIIDVELLDPMISDQPLIAKSDGVTLQPGESTVVEVDHQLTVGEAFPDGPIASKIDNVATVSGANETRDSFSEASDDASVFTEIVFAKVLPATGFGAGGLLPVSLLLIALGMAVLWLDRRRRSIY